MIIQLVQDSPEWHIFRSTHIGASEAAAVLGVCKYKTPYQLFLEKTNRTNGFSGNAYTEAGKLMEPKARAQYEIEHDFVTMNPVVVEHDTHKMISASLDGLSEDQKIILEIKYLSEASHNEAREGRVPAHYWPQVQHQLMCVPTAEELHYYSYRDGKGIKVVVKPDLKYQETLLQAELAFWELIKTDTHPPLTDKDAKLVYDDAIKLICKKLLSIKDTKDKEEIEKLKAQIIELGKHQKVRCGNVLVSKTTTKTGKDSYRLTVSNQESA